MSQARIQILPANRRLTAADEPPRHALLDGLPEGFALVETVYDGRGAPVDGRFREYNPALERLTGFRRRDVLGRSLSEVLAGKYPRLFTSWRGVARDGPPAEFDDFLPAPGRRCRVFAYRVSSREVALLITDITERRRREAALDRLNRTLKALSENNQAIMRATDENRYLADVCRIIVENCGHRMVWIGLAEDDDARTIRPVAHAGFDEGYIEALRLTWADRERGRGPTGTAIRTGKPSRCRNMMEDPDFAPWREGARARGYASSLSVPLIANGTAFGAIALYSREIDAFTDETVDLLTELADDTSHGLAALRARVAHAQADEALRAERDFVSAVLDTAGVVVVVLDRDGRIVRFNRAGEQLTGYTAAEVQGRAVWDFLVPPEDLRIVRRAWAATTAGDFPNTYEHYWLTKSGLRRLIVWSNTALTDAKGRIRNVIATGIDITDRKQVELEVRDREEELAAIYENAPLLMLLVDDERRIRKANKQTARFAHACVTDLLGRRAGEALRCIHARENPGGCSSGPYCQHCPLRRAILSTIRSGRGCQQVEVTLPLAANGASREVTFIVSTFRLDVRGQYLALVTLQDITDRKEAEQAVHRARAELELRVVERTAQLRALTAELTQSEERERRRIAGILHDQLQQLLGAARLRLEAHRRRRHQPGREENLRRIEQLIDESNAVARNLSHELSPVVLHEAGLAAGLRWLGRWMRDKHDLTVDVRDRLGAGPLAEDIKVLLFQSVRELLFNVVKHAGVKRAVVGLGRRTDGWLQITVSDRGRGFGRSRADVSRETGFGLFSIRERLTHLGGRMEIESRPGTGCRTRLLVPPPGRSGHLTPPANPRRRSGRKPAVGVRHRPVLRVLLADDHKITRDGLAACLSRRPGVAVVGLAADGRQVLDLVARLKPDVVVMDVSMPRIDGVDATRRIAARWPHVAVIGLTMHNGRAISGAMRAAGAVACLTKTGRLDHLVRAIRAAGRQTRNLEPVVPPRVRLNDTSCRPTARRLQPRRSRRRSRSQR